MMNKAADMAREVDTIEHKIGEGVYKAHISETGEKVWITKAEYERLEPLLGAGKPLPVLDETQAFDAVEVSKKKDVGEVSVGVDVDVSQALTGLKAVQREARKATQALRELQAEQVRKDQEHDGLHLANLPVYDEYKTTINLKYVPTLALVAELSKRTGVHEYESNGLIDLGNGYSVNIPGSSRVLVVTD